MTPVNIVLQGDKPRQLRPLAMIHRRLVGQNAFVSSLLHHEIARVVSLWKNRGNQRNIWHSERGIFCIRHMWHPDRDDVTETKAVVDFRVVELDLGAIPCRD